MPQSSEMPLLNLSMPGVAPGYPNHQRTRKDLYAPVLSSLRVVMIERMVKPEEVSMANSLLDL